MQQHCKWKLSNIEEQWSTSFKLVYITGNQELQRDLRTDCFWNTSFVLLCQNIKLKSFLPVPWKLSKKVCWVQDNSSLSSNTATDLAEHFLQAWFAKQWYKLNQIAPCIGCDFSIKMGRKTKHFYCSFCPIALVVLLHHHRTQREQFWWVEKCPRALDL